MANGDERARWSGGEVLKRITKAGEVKPMSIEADFRSVSASMTYHALRPTMEGISNAWMTNLLQEGFLVKDKSSGKHFLSMGCHDTAAWGIETDPEDNGVYLVMDGRLDLNNQANHAAIIARAKPLVIKELSGPIEDISDSCETYEAVPVTVRLGLNLQSHSGPSLGPCNGLALLQINNSTRSS